MLGWLNKLVDSNDKEIKRLQPIVGRVNALEREMEGRSDEALRELLAGFREQLSRDEADLEDFLPQTFAAVREERFGFGAEDFFDGAAGFQGLMLDHARKASPERRFPQPPPYPPVGENLNG